MEMGFHNTTINRLRGVDGVEEPPRKRFAVLVDCENAQRDAMESILGEIEGTFHAQAHIRRVYGDFSKDTSMRTWREFCSAQSFLPVHAFTHVPGKGSSDMALIIDAMELLYTAPTPLDGFCIISSDSDFTRLAQRLRESGKQVVGFGHHHAPLSFVRSCESFVFVDELVKDVGQRGKSAREDAPPKEDRSQVASDLARVHEVIDRHAKADGWVDVSRVASESKVKTANHGGGKYSKMLRKYADQFQVKTMGNVMYVKSLRK